MDNNIFSQEIPTLQANNYAEWSMKLSAAVMKKANINVMLGTVSMPQLEADLSNAQQLDGPLMWSQLKAVYSRTTSASRITRLEKLMEGQQGTGFTLNELNEELFCWTLIHQLDPTKYQDLRFSLIKDKALTKNSAISMVTTIESGLLAVTSPFDLAFNARSGPSSGAHSPSVKSPCKWCIGKQRHAEALKHTLEQCTGLEASIQHMVSKGSNNNKQPSKPKQSAAKPAVEEFSKFIQFLLFLTS
ncbi:hypothetical protein M408DRAFT_30657 [Serendipita vermifera MAFF 305830]|uniref:Uncharacterized protein n=1 Tax=Serendipita vermifera MAFF 305830 TaxID=933852 RepID=A0A0C2WR91_SERVB|nr:hypothetical protein M408DRAFT_30657 [Serendipita vermifera MAFF 305830]